MSGLRSLSETSKAVGPNDPGSVVRDPNTEDVKLLLGAIRDELMKIREHLNIITELEN